MARKPNTTRPSFFKVLIKDYTKRLMVPPAFVHKYGEYLPENAKLRTGSGETWEVEFEEIGNDKYCFTWGWNKFVKDVGLKLGEFLVFWFNGKSTYDVSVYGTNACEKEVSVKNLPSEDSDSDQDVKLSDDSNDATKMQLWTETTKIEAVGTDHGGTKSDNLCKEIHPQIKIVLTTSGRSRMSLGKGFTRAAGLIDKKNVVLEYPPKPRCWPVQLVHRLNGMHELVEGWPQFRKENGLVFGKSYLFEYNPTKNVIQVKESTNEEDRLSISCFYL